MINFRFLTSLVISIILFSGNIFLAISQGTITPIATTPNPEAQQSIYENIVVYQHYNDTTNWDIYMYDIGNGITTPICTANAEQWNPVIWENYIVWQDCRAGNWDIYMYNLLTGQEAPVCTTDRSQTAPRISDNIIVWQDYRESNWDIYMYNLISGQETAVCTAENDQEAPTISNWKIVWQDYRDWEWDIYLYNINNGETYPVCRDQGNQTSPSLSGFRLVWVDNRYGNLDIYFSLVTAPSLYHGYNLTRDAIDDYLATPADQYSPQINGERCVFINEISGDKDIYLYEFQLDYHGQVLPVFIDPDWQDWPAIYGERVLWSDFGSGNWDIYMWERPPGTDMAITGQDNPDPVEVGGYLTYQLLIANYGPGNATGVTVKDTLPANVELVTATSVQGNCTVNGNVVTANIGNMNSHSYSGVTIVVRTLSTGTLTNRTAVSANETDEMTTNNHFRHRTTVTALKKELVTPGWGPSMVVDSRGNAHLTHIRDGVGGTVNIGGNWHYYWLDDVRYTSNETGSWDSQIIYDGVAWNDPPGTGNPRSYHEQAVMTAIAIDSSDDIHLAYVGEFQEKDVTGLTKELDHTVYYKKREDGVWQNRQEVTIIEIVDDYVWGDPYIYDLNILVDGNGFAHIFFRQIPFTEENGSAKNSSRDLLSQGFGPIIHFDNESGSWESEIVFEYAYSDYAVAIDHNDNLHLSFYSFDIYPGGPHTEGIAYITNSPAGVWQPAEAIELNWSGGQMEGMFTDITTDHFNRPHVSYVSGQGNTQEDIRYAYKDSTTWNYTLVAPGSFFSRRNLITLDSGEFPHLFYIDVPSEELQMATNASGNWVIETFDPGPWYWAEFGFEFDRNNDMHVFVGKDEEIEYYLKSIQIDTDHDGLVDEEEHGPNGNDPNYDGNGDGIADSQQGNVASLHSEAGDQYVTIEAPDSTVLAYTRNISKPASGDPNAPPDPYCPYGFFQFTLFGIDAGRWVEVNLYLHGGPAIETYYKYGSTPDSTTDHWYEFDYIHPTGAVIHGDTVTLHLWDGLRGDDDLSGNGIIVEPGGPTLFVPSGLQSPDGPVPVEFALQQNYPNPFNPSTTIRYSLPRISDVEITIYNILGQKVFSHILKNQPAGTYNFTWDGRNIQKQVVASGMYIYRLKAGEFLNTRKMLLLR